MTPIFGCSLHFTHSLSWTEQNFLIVNSSISSASCILSSFKIEWAKQKIKENQLMLCTDSAILDTRTILLCPIIVWGSKTLLIQFIQQFGTDDVGSLLCATYNLYSAKTTLSRCFWMENKIFFFFLVKRCDSALLFLSSRNFDNGDGRW